MKTKILNYGIDAPGVIRNFLLIGIGICLVAIYFPPVRIGAAIVDLSGLVWMGGTFILMGLWMLTYSLVGKFKHRDRILQLISWTGAERVLDIGTGKGLLMIGAAKKLTTGGLPASTSGIRKTFPATTLRTPWLTPPLTGCLIKLK